MKLFRGPDISFAWKYRMVIMSLVYLSPLVTALCLSVPWVGIGVFAFFSLPFCLVWLIVTGLCHCKHLESMTHTSGEGI